MKITSLIPRSPRQAHYNRGPLQPALGKRLGASFVLGLASFALASPAAANGTGALASDAPSFRLDAINGVLCTAECGRYFREGTERFQQEIRQLEKAPEQVENDDALLRIDSNLSQQVESWQQTLESGWQSE